MRSRSRPPVSAPITDPSQLRVDYKRAALSERDAASDPIELFTRWFDEAVAAAIPEPNAMTLATVDAAGRPTARIVLMKGVDARGVVFHTNYDSRKGRDLAANPRAALLFFWVGLERQGRIDGAARGVSRGQCDAASVARQAGRFGRVLRRAPARLADLGLGIAAERAGGRPGVARSARRRIRGAL